MADSGGRGRGVGVGEGGRHRGSRRRGEATGATNARPGRALAAQNDASCIASVARSTAHAVAVVARILTGGVARRGRQAWGKGRPCRWQLLATADSVLDGTTEAGRQPWAGGGTRPPAPARALSRTPSRRSCPASQAQSMGAGSRRLQGHHAGQCREPTTTAPLWAPPAAQYGREACD